MKYFKAEIEETRRKTVFIQVPDDGNRDLAIRQYDAGVFGDLSEENNEKFIFTDTDHGVEYANRLINIEEADMKKEEKYADRYYEFPECVFWDEEQNCITKGWCD